MSNDHQNSPANQLPISAKELHHQPPSSSTGINHLPGYTTIRLPQSPVTPTANNDNSNTNTEETNNSTPESRLATAIGQAIFNIPSTSFQDVITATISPLIRTISDADSSVTQDPLITTIITPPKIPTNSPLRHAFSDAITTNYKQQPKKTTTKKPLRRALSDSAEYQQGRQKIRTPPTPRVSTSLTTASESSTRSEKLKDILRDFEQRVSEIICDQETAVEDDNTNPNPPQHQEEQEECVGVERLTSGDLKFELSCCCGKRFEMLIKPNGYCFYRLT